MKSFLFLISSLFCGITAFADCSGYGFNIFPRNKTVKQNTIFVLEGYAESQHIINGLNEKYPIYLKSGDKRVALLVSEICVGEFWLTQAVLRAATTLEAGVEYTLQIDNLPQYENLGTYNSATTKYDPIKYKVLAEVDTRKPVVNSKPKEIGKKLVYFGCGPAKSVFFSHTSKDETEILVKTTVKNVSTGKETTYYIIPEDNKIDVGHGMCSGAFTFDDNKKYEVEFDFMDASGNISKWIGERITFTSPAKETS